MKKHQVPPLCLLLVCSWPLETVILVLVLVLDRRAGVWYLHPHG